MMHIGKRIGMFVLLFWSLAVSAMTQTRGGEPPSVPGSLDYAAIKKDLVVFQGVIDTTVKQNVGGPFPLLASTRGTYLPEYGALFNLEVNLYQIRQRSPFDLRPHTEKELNDAYNLMVKRLENLKERLVRVMGEHGASLEQLKPNDSLTVIVHLFSVENEVKKPVPSQMILKLKKTYISDYRESRLSLADLAKKVEVVQF